MQLITVATASAPFLTTGALLAGADRQDAALRRVDDRGELLDAEHAEVGDREGAALELLELQLAGAGARGEVLHLGGDLPPGPCCRPC